VGRVEDGSTVSDFEPKSNATAYRSRLALVPSNGRTPHQRARLPGYADFASETEAALAVADLAVFVVSAVDGVEVQTEAMWRVAEAMGCPV